MKDSYVMPNKPQVFYLDCGFLVKVGHITVVQPTNHPSELVSNTQPVVTSVVIALHPDGFETLNTKYFWIGDKEWPPLSGEVSSGCAS